MPRGHDHFRHKKLYKLLSERLPERYLWQPGYEYAGQINITVLAARTKQNAETIRKWLRADRLSSRGARLLLEISDGRLSKEDLIDFLI